MKKKILLAAGAIATSVAVALTVSSLSANAAPATEEQEVVTENPDLVQVAAEAEASDGVVDATGAKKVAFFVFDKNSHDPSNSKLSWQVWAGGKKVSEKSWRSGSGNGTKNSCIRNAGWLPNGTYGGEHMTGFDGVINGIVWHLDDKKCSNGTQRAALFIHSEMTPSAGQNPNKESERWDGNGDYKSLGCVKLNPHDIKEAAKLYEDFYGKTAKQHKSKLLVVKS